LAQAALAGVLGCSLEDIVVAQPEAGTDWLQA
jgi:hypothetical protein